MNIVIKIILSILILTSCNAKDLDFNQIENEAQKNDKDIVIFFHIDGCRFCKSMIKENFNDKKILAYIDKNFILVDVNIDHKDSIKFKTHTLTKRDLAKKYSIFSYPSTLFLDKYKKVLYKDIGYKNKDEFLILLKFIKTKKYLNMKLEDFSSEAEFIDE